MTYQSTFKRYELKYLMKSNQKKELLQAMQPYMKLDRFGRTTIRNIYFDTDTYRLIRRSLEKPVYKEKLRIRSYKTVASDDPVFVELKKKYKSVVYKRRLILPESAAEVCFRKGLPLPVQSQIADEIEYFRSFYNELHQKVFLSYEREAYFCSYNRNQGDFRVTFDENILYRDYELSLRNEAYGTPLLKEDETLMEIKTAGGMPLWMSRELNRLGIFRISFSKYGAAYQEMNEKNIIEGSRRFRYAC